MRFNDGGKLMVPWGYVAGAHADPIEKKPFFHVEPGSVAYSFGMLGCSFHCAYCQNWATSQTMRDPLAGSPIIDITPTEIVDAGIRAGARSVISTFNEPLITSEWAVAIFRLAREQGLRTGMVSNGHGTPEVVDFVAQCLDMVKIDLKQFDDRAYRALGGRLAPVTETIRAFHQRGVWIEIVTLIVPDLNDGEAELTALAEFIASVSPDIPWHVTSFHADYRMTDRGNTGPDELARAASIGTRAGLRYVYAGNRPGQVDRLEHTLCPLCHTPLIERSGFRVLRNRMHGRSTCPDCDATVPGLW
jgi:pyruvate formate lyase activating enzyme